MNKIKLGQNQESIQASNQALLLELIRSEKNCSRATLAKLSGLQPTTVTYIVNDFIRCGIVEETGLISGARGRRSIGIAVTEKRYAVLGIRITRNGFSIGIFTLNNNPIAIEEHPIKNNVEAEQLVDIISNQALRLIATVDGYKILKAGIAVPGPYNISEEKIILMTGSVDWSNINIPKIFAEKLGLRVTCIHDASAGALSQFWNNKKINRNDTILYISVGQGVGAGILMKGQIINGSRGYAGEIGHMSIDYNGIECECGNRGCLEKYTSSIALTQSVNEKLGTNYSFTEVEDLIRRKNKTALKCFEACCDAMAIGIVSVFNCLDPDKIIFGDDIAKINPDLFIEKIQSGVRKRILPSILGNLDMMVAEDDINIELYGAGVAAIRSVYNNYSTYFG